eukprot:gene10765-17852_t
MTETALHTSLSVFIEGAYVAIQPAKAPGQSSSVALVDSPPQVGNPITVLAVLGLVKLITGSCLVVVTAASKVATLLDCDIYEVTQTKLITSPAVKKAKENKHLLKLLKDGTDPYGSARSLYFSYFYDVTLSSQRMAALANDPEAIAGSPAERAESTFFWNKFMSEPLMKAGAKRFVVPTMLGFIRQLQGLSFNDRKGKAVPGDLTIIARRSTQRMGTRHWRRGADTDGCAANFVETEQLLSIGSSSTVASFLQIRGSVPLLWTEMPNMKYKPTRVIAPAELQGAVFKKHVRNVVAQYKEVVAVSLVNLHGGEGKLAAAFEQEALAHSKDTRGKSPFRYVAFDFHKECKAGYHRISILWDQSDPCSCGGFDFHKECKAGYHRISILWDQISEDFTRWGFFLAEEGALKQQQSGVIRTNCIDCLDRTNVLQGVLARKALERILRKLGVCAVESQFKILWADHGDAVSTQYAGSGAMKSGFTRTGKRTFGGVVDDGVKAVSRYYLNNFQDGRKQGCSGSGFRAASVAIICGGLSPAPFSPCSAWGLIAIICIYCGFGAISESPSSSTALHVVVNILAPLLVGAVVLLLWCRKNG